MPQRFLAFLLIPLLFAACSTNNVTVDNGIGKYFDSAGVKGSFGFYDNGQGHFTIYNLSRFRDSFYAPGGTFDILQGLIALQTGTAANDTSAVGATSLSTIIKSEGNDTVSLALANAIGKDTIKKWVDTVGYGNKDAKDLDKSILEGRLAIPADQQMGLIKKLYFGQLPFFQRNQDLVKKMFFKEQNSNYTLTYKTGKTIHNGVVNAWVLGWVEENKHPYFFVLNMESADRDLKVSNIGTQLVKNILSPMGFFAGKK